MQIKQISTSNFNGRITRPALEALAVETSSRNYHKLKINQSGLRNFLRNLRKYSDANTIIKEVDLRTYDDKFMKVQFPNGKKEFVPIKHYGSSREHCYANHKTIYDNIIFSLKEAERRALK